MTPNFASYLGAMGLLLFSISAYAQTNSPPPTEHQASPPPAHDAQGGAAVLSDTMGVDLDPYLKTVVLAHVRQNWCTIIPEQARPPISKKGKVAIEFAITKDGSVTGMRLDGTSSNVVLDRAAWGGITMSNPFPPLPAEFPGRFLLLRLTFFYKLPAEVDQSLSHDACESITHTDDSFGIAPIGPVKVAAGKMRTFFAGIGGSASSSVSWSLTGDACAKSDCGSISASGLYTAPSRVPDPAEVTVTATQKSSLNLKTASATVTITAP